MTASVFWSAAHVLALAPVAAIFGVAVHGAVRYRRFVRQAAERAEARRRRLATQRARDDVTSWGWPR